MDMSFSHTRKPKDRKKHRSFVKSFRWKENDVKAKYRLTSTKFDEPTKSHTPLYPLKKKKTIYLL